MLLLICCLHFIGCVLLAASIFKTETTYVCFRIFLLCTSYFFRGFFANLVAKAQPKLPDATMAESLQFLSYFLME